MRMPGNLSQIRTSPVPYTCTSSQRKDYLKKKLHPSLLRAKLTNVRTNNGHFHEGLEDFPYSVPLIFFFFAIALCSSHAEIWFRRISEWEQVPHAADFIAPSPSPLLMLPWGKQP